MNIITIRKKLQEKLIPEHLRAAGIVPVLAYSEDDYTFLMDDKSIGFGFYCHPLCGADEKIQERVNGFMNQEYPAKTTMQFILFRSPDLNHEMYRMMGLRDGYRDDLLTSSIEQRMEFLQKHTTERMVAKCRKGTFDLGLIHDLKLFVTVKVPIKHANEPSQEELDSLANLRTKVESSLRTIGVHPVPLTAVGYIRTMNTMLNWGPEASWRTDGCDWETDKPICEQIFDYGTDLEVDKSGLRLGDYHVKVMSAKKMPDSFYFGDAITFVGDLSGGNSAIRENYMVVTNLFFPEVENTKNSLERKRQFTVNQAYGPMLKFVPVLADKKNDFDVLYESLKEGSKPVRVSYSLVLFAPTAERAQAAATAARNIWRENRFEMMEDKFISLPMFINCLPFCTDRKAVKDLFRYKTMTTEQASVLLPVFGEWKGTGTFHSALISRNGQLMSLSLHDSDTNKNLVVAAESGSGKSFLTNELIFSYLSEGAQVWVIDAGKSYKDLCELLKGDFVHFAEGSNICLNPFELISNWKEEEDGVVSIVKAMASEKGLLDEFQLAGLKQIMNELWDEKGREMTVDHIAERCRESGEQRIKDVGQQLYAFTSKGSYGSYFSGSNNVNFQNRFTVLELDELQGRKHLRQVVLLQMIYQIQQEMFLGERNRKKVVIIDEAWDLLKEGEVSTFMEHQYRKARKYGGSIGICTQSINDLYENPVGRAIAENSASMYLLGQTEESVESVKRSGRLSLSEGGFHTLKTVHTILGAYSEIFIKSKAGIGVGRLVVGDFQKLLYSTDPDDIRDINKYVDQGLNITDAIRQVMHQRGMAA
ncbi:type IV secretion system protein TraC [Vibrio parahaemolyticus]